MDRVKITRKPNQKVFFTSDLHIGHENILSFCNRPFTNISDMNKALIGNWNSVVGKDDIVFNLGDMIWRRDEYTYKTLYESLNGFKYHILGNHDKQMNTKIDNVKLLSDIVLLSIDDEYYFYLSHFPLMTWSRRENGYANLHGHIHLHDGMRHNMDSTLPFHYNQLDVGVDNSKPTRFYPMELEDVLRELDKKKLNYYVKNQD